MSNVRLSWRRRRACVGLHAQSAAPAAFPLDARLAVAADADRLRGDLGWEHRVSREPLQHLVPEVDGHRGSTADRFRTDDCRDPRFETHRPSNAERPRPAREGPVSPSGRQRRGANAPRRAGDVIRPPPAGNRGLDPVRRLGTAVAGEFPGPARGLASTVREAETGIRAGEKTTAAPARPDAGAGIAAARWREPRPRPPRSEGGRPPSAARLARSARRPGHRSRR